VICEERGHQDGPGHVGEHAQHGRRGDHAARHLQRSLRPGACRGPASAS
jgi:hypothetical protein